MIDINKIRLIVATNVPDNVKERLILGVIADDKDAIPTILQILNIESEQNKELLLDTNLELSRAFIVLNDENLKWNKKITADPKWVVGEIKKHYEKWKDKISCCFNIQ